MELNDSDCRAVGERISEEVRNYMEKYYEVQKRMSMSSSNSGNLKKLQQTLYIARGGKRIPLHTLGHEVRMFMEKGKKPDWY